MPGSCVARFAPFQRISVPLPRLPASACSVVKRRAEIYSVRMRLIASGQCGLSCLIRPRRDLHMAGGADAEIHVRLRECGLHGVVVVLAGVQENALRARSAGKAHQMGAIFMKFERAPMTQRTQRTRKGSGAVIKGLELQRGSAGG